MEYKNNNFLYILIGSAGAVLLFLLHYSNYLLFHSITEIFSVCVAFAIFMIVWNCKDMIQNNFLLFVGISYLFVGILDFVHTLAYPGMSIFKGIGYDPATQLWIAARYTEAAAFLAGSYFVKRKVNTSWLLTGGTVLVAAVLLSIFVFPIFPECLNEQTGLTSFKIISEFIIITMLGFGLYRVFNLKSKIGKKTTILIAASISMTIYSELTFTLYSGPSDAVNAIGHILKFISFYLIYKVLIYNGLRDPFNTIFMELQEKKNNLDRALRAMTRRSLEMEYLLDSARNILKEKDFEKNLKHVLFKCRKIINTEIAAAVYDGNFISDSHLNKPTVERLENIKKSLEFENKTVRLNEPGSKKLNIIYAPLQAGGEVAGGLIFCGSNQFSKYHLKIARAFSKLASIGLSNHVAMRSLAESEERFARFMEYLPANVYMSDQQGKYSFVNKSFVEFSGREKNDIIGKGHDFIWPEDLAKQRKNDDLEVIQNDCVIEKIEQIPTEKGMNHFLTRKFSVDFSKLKLAGSISIDITELKQAEQRITEERQRFLNVLDSMADPVYIVNQRYEIEYTNPAMEKEFGPVNSRKCYEYMGNRNEPCPWCRYKEVSMGSTVRWQWTNQKTEKIYDCIDAPVRDTDGSILKLKIVRDVTERQRMAESLKQARDNLEIRVQQRTVQLNNLVKQLRSEVTERVKAEQEIRENQDKLRSLTAELLQVEERERRNIAEQLHDSIGQLLAFSKREIGQIRKQSDHDVRVQLENVWNLIGQAVDQTRTLTFELSSPTLYAFGLEAAIEEILEVLSVQEKFEFEFNNHGDNLIIDEHIKILLFRSVRELLINTAKHAKAKNVKLDLIRQNGNLLINLEDDGKGFDPKKVFESTKLSSYGLFSLKERIATVKGEFNIESAPGKGTKVKITTPVSIN